MTNTYAKAYTEVLEILSHISKEEYSKIPQEKINFYKNNMEKNYEYKIDPNIDLSKQYISKEANAILISIFRDYFANDRQRQTLNNLLNQNQDKIENIKREKYNLDNFFKKEIIKEDVEKIEYNQVSMSEYKVPIFKRILNKIKGIFHIN